MRGDVFMRVAFISHSAELCGAERSLLDLVVGVRMHGIHPTVVVPEYGPLVEEFKRNNISYIIHSYRKWVGGKNKTVEGIFRYIINRMSAPKLARMLRERDIDLVYSNSIVFPVGAMVANAIGVKHVWHIREFVQEDMGADFDFGTPFVARFIEKNSSFIIYNSHAVKKKFMPLLEGAPGAVISNGWLTGKSPGVVDRCVLTSDKPIKLCIVGSVHRGKGQHEAIEALSVLRRKFSHVVLEIVGVGDVSYTCELEKLCASHDVSESVTFSGYSGDVSSVFRRSDIALVCSRNEAFGRVVVEAMAEGCPVVASRSGGVPEIIECGVNGLLYKCGNVEDLVQQVSLLIDNPSLYSSIARNGIMDVYKRFSRKRYVEQIHSVLESL
mgnify:CR=1 FL=1